MVAWTVTSLASWSLVTVGLRLRETPLPSLSTHFRPSGETDSHPAVHWTSPVLPPMRAYSM